MSRINNINKNIQSPQSNNLGMSDNAAPELLNILSMLDNYFYNETKLSSEEIKMICPYLLLNTMSYEKIKDSYSLSIEPKLLEEKEQLFNKDSFELGYVYGGLGYNNKAYFIYCLATQSQYEKEFGKVEDYDSMIDWFSPYCENCLDGNPKEEMRRYDIVGLFRFRMDSEKKETKFPFNSLARALTILE